MDRNGTANYTYDTLNRLIEAVSPLPTNPLETYNYDEVGNRLTSNQNGASAFNQANQLLEDASFTYQYDNNGNLTRKTNKVTLAFTNYEYDAENKLARVVSNGTVADYRYDGLGRRVEKQVTQGPTTNVPRYIYDNEDILLELDGSNNILARYTHGPGIDEPLVMEKGGASFFYHADGLGSIAEITDSTGVVKQRYTYSSFGKIESQLDPTFIQPYTFTSREFDSETGLYFYRVRYYDSGTGRFLQEDPILAPFVAIRSGGRIDQLVWQLPSLISNPRLLHPFSYVRNNPTTLVDPSGLFPKCPCGSHLRFSLNDFLSCIARNSAALGFFGVGCLGAVVLGLNPAVPLPVTIIALTVTCGQTSFIVGQCIGESYSCWQTWSWRDGGWQVEQ